MNRFGRIIAIPLLLTLTLPLAACGPEGASNADAHSWTPASSQTDDPDRTDAKTVSAEDLETAVRLEHAMRDWGTDPTINPKDLARQDATVALARLKGSIPKTNPVKDLLPASMINDDEGPDGRSPICRDNPDSMACSGIPTARDWLTREAWAYGAKWTKGPTAVADGDAILVTGTVRTVLLQDDDSFAAGDWHAITPAWRDYEIRDRITMRDGKATRIESLNADPWWISPWLHRWDRDMPAGVGAGERMAIPVRGAPSMNLAHDGYGRILKGPVTQADLNGKVDWSLWSDIPMASVGGGCQNPGYCD